MKSSMVKPLTFKKNTLLDMETDWGQDEPIILWIPEAQGIEENEKDSRYWSLPLPNIEMSLYISTLDVTEVPSMLVLVVHKYKCSTQVCLGFLGLLGFIF